MPTNLPPEYFEAEKKLKRATALKEKISALEKLISTVPKHKGTDKLRADLRRKLSQLREEFVRKKKSGQTDSYAVERQGAAQVVLLGFPNSGKSSVLATLTNAHPVIADYPMSTALPLSGMMPFEDIQFQLVDLPPIGNESTDGRISGIARNSDVLTLVVDLSDDPEIQAELLISQISEWKISDKQIVITGNKSDLPESESRFKRLQHRYGSLFPVTSISTTKKQGMEELRRIIFENANIIRVYSKEPGKEPAMNTPFILHEGSSVLNLAELIHNDFVVNMKYACIWGSAKFEGQRVQKDYVLHDRDVVEFHLK
ncbi:MAG: 50S ribosome-binding GTPase [Nitrospirae bacterium]|nr:50S ribosome-binding GTPase [Nitrospirota bacterium]